MFLQTLNLKNFRNYTEANVECDPRLNIIYGKNAQGKSNLLEAINYLTTASSQRVNSDSELVMWGAKNFRLEGLIQKATGPLHLTITFAEKKTITLNGQQVSKIGELLGKVNTVLFAPEDLNIVKGGPQERRRFLDDLLVQLSPQYHYFLLQYSKVLFQRNNLLKMLRDGNKVNDQLEVWDEQLVQLGSRVMAKRLEIIGKLNPLSAAIHYSLSGRKEQIDLKYCSNAYPNFSEKLFKARKEEIRRGITLIGPHRDDIDITFDGISLRVYGSQGQQRTASLSLKLGQLELLRQETGEEPILLLDDVLSELDQERSNLLLKQVVPKVQTFLTTTDIHFLHILENIPHKLLPVDKGALGKIS